MKKIYLILILFLCLIPAPTFADTVELRDGKIIEGTIISESEDSIIMDTGLGMNVNYYLDEVHAINDKLLFEPIIEPEEESEVKSFLKIKTEIQESAKEQIKRVVDTGKAREQVEGQVDTMLTDLGLHNDIRKKVPSNVRKIRSYFQNNQPWLYEKYQIYNAEFEKIQDEEYYSLFLTILYLLFCFPLFIIATRMRMTNPVLAWVPFLNLILMVNMTGRSMWYLVGLFIPILQILLLVNIWMDISGHLRQSKWLGLLILLPGINILMIWYLAFSKFREPKSQRLGRF